MSGNQFRETFPSTLTLILSLFLVKEVLLASLTPIFQGTDEPVHYATILSQNTPTPEYFTKISDTVSIEASSFYFFEIASQKTNLQNFQDTRQGENQIINQETNTVSISNTPLSFYYTTSSAIVDFLESHDAQTKMLVLRIFSLFIGVFFVFLSYHIVRTIGFSQKASALFSATIAFQPMFSFMSAIVNIDVALFLAFALYTYFGVLLLRNGPSAKNILLLISSAVLGIAAKGPGIILIATTCILFGYILLRKYAPSPKKILISAGVLSILITGTIAFFAPRDYLVKITKIGSSSKFDSPFESIGKYLDKTMDTGELRDSSLSYWGNFGWLDTPIPEWILSVINWIEIIGFVAVLVYLLAPVLKKKNWIPAFLPESLRESLRAGAGVTEKTDDKIGTRSLDYARDDKEGDDGMGWVPERRYLVFFLGMILALQFAIRFYDWRVFDASGQVLIGQPGRYFLPNLIGHLVLVVVGIGLAVSWVKRWIAAVATLPRNDKIDFEMILKILALAMILLQLYAIVNVIIPRYYL
jgi:4-amino-4-deoxy-L-arabinose transferase-like glycosyltransferase